MTTPEDDADRTLLRSAPGRGGSQRADMFGEYADSLPPGTRLHEFELISVIGQGGFGIVYLAHDLTLDRKVAIKEYMPSALATRTQAMTVAVRSPRHADTFAAGLRSFINEARLLAQFDHPSLLKVHRFWEAHGTAYMVMPFYAGTTLGKTLLTLGGPPDEAWLKALLHPLLHALELMHGVQCYHRDIAPDNILILPDGRPLLLDFGAARRVISNMTKALTVILKTGYAPVEQYGEMPDMSQGPWTDLYALGSVVQFAIMGHTPPQAVARFLSDKRELLAVTARGRYSASFLNAIDRTLAVLPKDRPQSIAELRELMDAGPPASMPAPPSMRAPESLRPVEGLRDSQFRQEPSFAVVAADSGFATTAAASNWKTTAPTSNDDSTLVDSRYAAPRKKSVAADDDDEPSVAKRAWMVLGVIAAVFLAAAGTWAGFAWLDLKLDDLWKTDTAPAKSATMPATREAPPPASPLPTPAPEPAPAAAQTPAPKPEVITPTAPAVTPSPSIQQPLPIPAPSSNSITTPPMSAPAESAAPEPTAPPAKSTSIPVPTPAPESTPRMPMTDSTPTVESPQVPMPAPAPTTRRTARPPAVEPRTEPSAEQRTPRNKLPSARCADIIQRASLGEEITVAEKTYLKQECGQ
jgi:serine/threonine protein kinase